jgi:hypothetical protein
VNYATSNCEKLLTDRILRIGMKNVSPAMSGFQLPTYSKPKTASLLTAKSTSLTKVPLYAKLFLKERYLSVSSSRWDV